MKKSIIIIFCLFPFFGFPQKPRYFAELKNDTVQRVIVIESAELAVSMFSGQWVETFIDSLGKNYAGPGFLYHHDKENFSSPSPFPSWILDDSLIWIPPIPYPDDGLMYVWDEENRKWILVSEFPTP